jgi:phage terminase small subunit
MQELDRRESVFVEEYLIDLDPQRAAIKAGYSATMARSKAYQWVSNSEIKPHVFAAIEKAMAKRSQRTQIAADDVLKEFAKIGMASLSDVTDWGVKEVAIGYDADGKKLKAEDIGQAAMVSYIEAPYVVPICRDDLPEHIRAAVAEVSLTKDGFKIKMHDKVQALTQIGRHLGMFTDKTEVGGHLTVENWIVERRIVDTKAD